MWSAMKDALSHEENLDARHQHLLVHHARAAGSGAEAPGAGGAVNATMFDRYLPFSCPLRYFRY